MSAWRVGLMALLLAWLAAWQPAQAGIEVDAERELQLLGQGVVPPKRFGNVSFRVAVFSYQDPDGLDLGDALATLASHELLAGATVSSIGVLRYIGRLTPAPGETQGYFDKVELLARHQEPTVAVWGMVRRAGQRMVVETYLQLPEATLAKGFESRLVLPAAMGGGTLQARLAGDRLLLQRHSLPLAAAAGLRQAAQRLNELRAAPRLDAQVLARLPLQTVYYVLQRQGAWVRMGTSGDRRGWVPLSGHCTGECAPLLEAPRFVSGLLAFMARRQPPAPRDALAPDARQLADHLLAMAALDNAPAPVADREAMAVLAKWQPQPSQSAADGPALGATGANLRLLAWITGELRRARTAFPKSDRGAYDRLVLAPERLRDAVYEAADATRVDPRNIDLLHNLQVLYAALGDDGRARLAGELLARARAERRPGW